MRRRELITLTNGASVAWPFAVKAQQTGRTYRYGIVAPFPCESAPINIALSDEMRRWGFINGQNLTINCHEFGANNELSSDHAAIWSGPRSTSSWPGGCSYPRGTACDENNSDPSDDRRYAGFGTVQVASPP